MRLEPTKVENPEFMIIGLNPSVHSSMTNAWDDPFGVYLEKILIEAGIDKSTVWLTNLWKEPTENNDPLDPILIVSGYNEIAAEIREAHPKHIILLGKQVWEAFGINDQIIIDGSYTWGRDSDLYKATIDCMYHPSYLKYNQKNLELRAKYIERLKTIKDYKAL